MHGLPITEDNNSYHYGMAVNGFHPQVNAQDNPIIPLSANHTFLTSSSTVKLVDGRHHQSKHTSGKERNEREQKRAQKITDLIDQLRLSMEKGGWRVEIKSKFHTLNTCADYMKHLIKTTQEKEAAVEQAKLDLTVRECKLEEDKGLLESRSDPESVTSTLTASTSASGGVKDSEKMPPVVSRKDSSSGSDDDKKRLSSENEGATTGAKKACRVTVNESSAIASTSTDGSSGEDGASGGSGGPSGVQNISIDKMSSSVSDMTDSNRGSSNGCKGKSSERMQQGDSQVGASEAPSSSSISSTAAVVRGEGIWDRPHGHADVVIKKKKSSHAESRKRRRQELTSLEKNFQLDYEEVFLKSNVPQVIASSSGRIVVWNDFFLKSTGLTNEEASRLTIFSIVETDKLSDLFDMVAQALRSSSSSYPHEISSGSSGSGSSGSVKTDKEEKNNDSSRSSMNSKESYPVLTLPCVRFPASRERRAVATSHHPNPLYITVTLLPDEDPRKRCFHCIFTDCPGTKGSLGSVTPELLAMLFTDHKHTEIVHASAEAMLRSRDKPKKKLRKNDTKSSEETSC